MIVAAGAARHQQAARSNCRLGGAAAAASPTALGELVRTNSESRSSPVTVPEDDARTSAARSRSPPASTPIPHTHIETVTYGEAGDSMSTLYTLMVGDGTR